MATIKAGTYVFVEEPIITAAYNQSLNYKVHYLTAENVYATDTYDTVRLSVNVRFGGSIMLREANSTDFPVTGYKENTKQWISSFNESQSNLTATDNTKLRTIIVETDQTVADDFYTWFTANTSLQPKLSIDLTTLPGWANLSTGNHTIKIKAKGTGYKESELSEGVTVTKPAAAYTDCLTFTGETSDFTLAVGSAGAKEWDGTVEYSTDHNTWTVWNGTAVSSIDKKLYLRGSGNTTFNTSKGARLSLSARAACSGNIQTLLEYSNPPTSISASNCYKSMFRDCTSLTTAPALPATTLADLCYSFMFYGCTNLTQAPALPATTLTKNCYCNMFQNCASLTQAPELPATTLETSCYSNMFKGCANLTTAPALPATTLASTCYRAMFYGCTSLTTAPTLPATTLADNCYTTMFSGCTSLTAAPELPATTLALDCYGTMFFGCSKLKVNTSSGNKIFTCPSTIPNNAVSDMFGSTGGSFTGTPTAGNTYYWTE